MYKKLSASPPNPPPGDLPLDPAGGSAPRPPFRLALRALAMHGPPFGKSWIRHCWLHAEMMHLHSDSHLSKY